MSHKNSQKFLGIAYATVSAIVFGAMPLMMKSLYRSGMNAYSAPFFRTLVVSAAMGVMIRARGRSLRVSARSVPLLVIAAVFGLCLTPIALYLSYHTIPSGLATTLHFLYPVLVALVSVLVLREPLPPLKLAALLISVVGIFLLFDIGAGGRHIDLSGTLSALFSAGTYAVYILLTGSRTLRNEPGDVAAFYMNLSATVVTGIYIMATGRFSVPDSAVMWVALVVFSLLIGVGGSVLFQYAVRYIGPQSASILSTLEPIVGVLIGALILSETLSVRAMFGVILIPVSVILLIRSENRTKEVQ